MYGLLCIVLSGIVLLCIVLLSIVLLGNVLLWIVLLCLCFVRFVLGMETVYFLDDNGDQGKE